MRNGFSTDNFRKRFFALLIFLSAAFLLSCSHGFERNEERDGTEKSQPCIVKGKISLFGTGAVPAAISKTQTQNGRTALPAPEISSYTHKVTAANGSSTKEAEVSTDESGNIVFSVVLEAGTWTFTAETFDSADSKVFESEGTEKEIGEGDNSVALVLKPLTETGEGSVKLPVTVDSSIKKMETSSSKTELNAIELDFTSSATGEISVADIESGSYSVAFHFYDESGALVYSFTETVNVYPNLETNSWLNSGKYINSDKEIEITSALISSFQNSAFFVKSSGSSNGSGGFFDPFDSITTAATVIANTLAESEYEIFLLDDLSENQSIDLSATTNSLKISVQGYDSSERTISPSDKTATTLTINGNAGLEIKFSKILMTVESETADGTSTDGGGISVSGTPKVTLEDCGVSGFVSSGSKGGGGIYNEGTLILLGSTRIYGNDAKTGCGGGIYNEGGTVILGGSAVVGDKSATATTTGESGHYSNHALKHGGGIYSNGGAVYIGYTDESTEDTGFDGGICYNYTSWEGGAIYSGSSTKIVMSGGSVSYNGSYGNAGGIRLSGGGDSFEMSGGSVVGNAANLESSNEFGGGIYVGGSGDGGVTITGGVVRENSAYSGGGIYSKRNVEISGDATIESNRAKGTGSLGLGGGIYTDGEVSIFIGGSAKISGNTSLKGGGIYTKDGGKIHFGYTEAGTEDSNFSGEISGNTATAYGGGICSDSGSGNPELHISGGEISGNTAGECGGGIYLGGASALTMSGGKITTNTTDEDGGGIYIDSNASLTIEDGEIRGNTADEDGGGIYNNNEISMIGGTISGNSAGGNGKGIYQSGIFEMNGSAFVKSDNDVYLTGYCYVYIEGNLTSAYPVATITPETYKIGTQILKTTSSGTNYVSYNSEKFDTTPNEGDSGWYISGDGYLSNSSTVTHKITFDTDGGTEITTQTVADGETATQPISDPNKEGYFFLGWYNDSDLSAEFDFDTAITEDTTIYAGWGSTTLYVSSSGADTNSGYTEASALLTLQAAVDKISTSDDWTIIVSGTVTGTTTISSISASSLTIKGKTGYSSDILDASGSSSAVIDVENAVPVTISNLTLQNGEMGLLHSGTESITIESCQIIKNTAGGLFFSSESDSTVKDSTIGGSSANSNTSENGGGITKSGNGTLTIENSTISNNTATSYGGGIYIDGGKVIFSSGSISNNTGSGIYIKSGNATISGGSISNNTSAKGAGIYLSSTTSTLTLTGGSITENSATNNGGGIFMSNGSATISGGSIESNSANYNGGGIYMANGDFDFTGGSAKSNTANYGNGLYIAGGTFTMSGSAVVDSSNDVYLSSGTYITIGGTLSEATAATITPGNYSTGTQVLKDGSGTVADNYAKFSVTTDPSGQAWTVNSSGYLSENSSTTSYSATFDTSSYSSGSTLKSAILSASDAIEIVVSSDVDTVYLGLIAGGIQNASNITSCTLEFSSSGLTEIPAYSFSNLSTLTKVILSANITSIGIDAFQNCSNLTSVVFSDTSKTWTANGTSISVTDASTNATNLTTTYAAYAWTAN